MLMEHYLEACRAEPFSQADAGLPAAAALLHSGRAPVAEVKAGAIAF